MYLPTSSIYNGNFVLSAHPLALQDVGVLAAFFLNLVSLRPGQAMYLPANEPHAYVSGELMEAMATSDNVVRAGLTPKLRDTAVLCDSLTYNQVQSLFLLNICAAIFQCVRALREQTCARGADAQAVGHGGAVRLADVQSGQAGCSQILFL